MYYTMFDFRYIRNRTKKVVKIKMFFGKRFSGHESGIVSGLDILVLSIIENYDGISGYDLIRNINDKFEKLWHASPGTIYPLLNRLTKRGFVQMEMVIKNNRNLKLYRITELGQKKLKEVLKSNLEPSINTMESILEQSFRHGFLTKIVYIRLCRAFHITENIHIEP